MGRRLNKKDAVCCSICSESVFGKSHLVLIEPSGSLPAGARLCVRREHHAHRIDPNCCAAAVWEPSKQCAARAAPGSHACSFEIYGFGTGRWLCRKHRALAIVGVDGTIRDDTPALYNEARALCADVASQHSNRFCLLARARVLQVAQIAPVRSSWGGKAKDLWYPFIVEVLSAHQRRRAGWAPPYSNDPIIHAGFFESPLDELDRTSAIVAAGVASITSSLGQLDPTTRANAIARAIFGARWMGGKLWCKSFLGRLSPSSLLSDHPKDYNTLALSLIREMITHGKNPLSEAHQPHNRVHAAVEMFIMNGDLELAIDLSSRFWLGRKGGSTLVEIEVDDSSGESEDDVMMISPLTPGDQFFAVSSNIVHAAIVEKSCTRMAAFWSMVTDCKGTLLVQKTPLRDLCRALADNGVAPLPSDYFQWGPPGPGARRCMTRLTLSGPPATNAEKRRRKSLKSDHAAGAATATGRAFAAQLVSLHAELVGVPEQKAVLERFARHEWGVHDTQGSMCVYNSYLELRGAIMDGEPLPSHPRWYKGSASTWKERAQGDMDIPDFYPPSTEIS